MAHSIQTNRLSKRYQYQWIIRDMDLHFTEGKIWGIAGGNGSGKSTLMNLLSGYVSPSLGAITWTANDKKVKADQVFQYISWVAPYTDLIHEFTLQEMFDFHQKFKPLQVHISFAEFENLIQLKGQSGKPLNYFSSGMKQKIQLALAVLSATPFLLLDEPTSFLDEAAKKWFADLLTSYSAGRVVVIASNDSFDLALCQHTLTLPAAV